MLFLTVLFERVPQKYKSTSGSLLYNYNGCKQLSCQNEQFLSPPSVFVGNISNHSHCRENPGLGTYPSWPEQVQPESRTWGVAKPFWVLPEFFLDTCWWQPEIRDQLTSWYGIHIPLFIGFQHHPRWWSPDFFHHQYFRCSSFLLWWSFCHS